MRIAHLSAEVSPIAKTGGLGDVAGALPKALAEMGHDVTLWMPLYRQARAWLAKNGRRFSWVMDPFLVAVGPQLHEVGVVRASLPGSNVPLYLVGSEPHFDRPEIYAGTADGRDDGLSRYALFVRASLSAMRRLDRIPDVLHAHDWHAALATMALAWDRKNQSQTASDFSRTATVLTIHNAAHQGLYPGSLFPQLGLPDGAFSEAGVGMAGAINLLKGGILAADAVTAVSPSFAREIMTPGGGFGLDDVLRFRGRDLHGIVNGIDPAVWNPAVDMRIPRRYDRHHPDGKLENRSHLLRLAGMDANDRNLVIGIVGRLSAQKGYDLLFPVLSSLLHDGIRFVFLGSGDGALEQGVRRASHDHPGRFFGHVGFDDDLAHLIEAGSDAFLMPSRFEPCGLNQLYSLAYGTPPIVRRTGGLADTVLGYDGRNAQHANGFSFDDPTPSALRDVVRWAHMAYQNPRVWTQLIDNGMSRDHSWRRSAERYEALYNHLTERKNPRIPGSHIAQ